MIEISFGESEAASMKVVKNKIVIGRANGKFLSQGIDLFYVCAKSVGT